MNAHLMMTFVIAVSTAQADDQPAQVVGQQYKVAFWYELDRPFSTTKYRAYNLAKGEYHRETVDRWLKTIFEQHPRYGATVRDLSTVGEPGATEAERLTSAIEREKRRWVDLNLGSSKPVPKVVNATSAIRTVGPAVGRASLDRPAPGSPGSVGNPPTSPFPYPYRSGIR